MEEDQPKKTWNSTRQETTGSYSPLTNTVTWSLAEGSYRPVFEDDEGIFYIAEKPVIRISPVGDSLGSDSGIFVAKSGDAEVRWAIWSGRSPLRTKYIDAPFPPFIPQK